MNERDTVQSWFSARIPSGWFTGPVSVSIDAEEILVTGVLADPPATGEEPVPEIVRLASVKRFREETRDARMAVAGEAEALFRRRVSWAVDSGGGRILFTTVSVPVMTRLRQPERVVLDTLVEAGVARSRSDALAWCVRLVGRHQGDWIRELQEALVHVQRVRADGPAEG